MINKLLMKILSIYLCCILQTDYIIRKFFSILKFATPYRSLIRIVVKLRSLAITQIGYITTVFWYRAAYCFTIIAFIHGWCNHLQFNSDWKSQTLPDARQTQLQLLQSVFAKTNIQIHIFIFKISNDKSLLC